MEELREIRRVRPLQAHTRQASTMRVKFFSVVNSATFFSVPTCEPLRRSILHVSLEQMSHNFYQPTKHCHKGEPVRVFVHMRAGGAMVTQPRNNKSKVTATLEVAMCFCPFSRVGRTSPDIGNTFLPPDVHTKVGRKFVKFSTCRFEIKLSLPK